MASVNKKLITPRPLLVTGTPASRITPEQTLRRMVLAHLLWEDNFYINGKSVAAAIAEMLPKVAPQVVRDLAIEAREIQNMRHTPLFMVREMARSERHRALVAETLAKVIQRPDEIAEYLAIYFKDNPNQPLSAGSKKGLAAAFNKFNEFKFAKNNQDGAFTLKDAIFLVHPRPKDETQADIFKKIIGGFCKTCGARADKHVGVRGGKLKHEFVENKLMIPNTWETRLSRGESKKSTFADLIESQQIGGMAMLRNLRNMKEAGLPKALIRKGLLQANYERVLPFRFIAAAVSVPEFEDIIEEAFLEKAHAFEKLPGHSVVIIDVSGSMEAPLSQRPRSYVNAKGVTIAPEPMTRLQAAAALAMLVREQTESVSIYATAGSDSHRRHDTRLLRPRRGFALRDEVMQAFRSQGGGGIFLTQVMDYCAKQEAGNDVARTIVLTDEQDTSGRTYDPALANAFGRENYIINVSSEKYGIGYNKFNKIDGWSEAALHYIHEIERDATPMTKNTRQYRAASAGRQ